MSWRASPMCIKFSVRKPCTSRRTINNNGGLPGCVCADDSEFIKASPTKCRCCSTTVICVLYGCACLPHCCLVCPHCSVAEGLMCRYAVFVYTLVGSYGAQLHYRLPAWHPYYSVLSCLFKRKNTKETPFGF